MAFKAIIEEVRKLSQEEGLHDDEIAKIIGCSRATVNKVRKDNNIPLSNLNNRKDKEYTCLDCKKVVKIKRSERRELICPECVAKLYVGKVTGNKTV